MLNGGARRLLLPSSLMHTCPPSQAPVASNTLDDIRLARLPDGVNAL
jgi:hypothetical protein